MAYPLIIFNASTGSDSQASGSPYSLTAVYGSAAAHTNGSSTTTITLTNTPDLSALVTYLAGSQDDGAPLLWLNTASGRQASKITAADNSAKTVTVSTAFNIDSGSPVDYAIGGKRATFEGSSQIFSDSETGGWIYETETDQTLTAALTVTPASVHNSPLTIRGDNETKRTIDQTTLNANGIYVPGAWNVGSIVQYEYLTFICSAAGTRTSGAAISSLNHIKHVIKNCTIGDPTDKWFYGFYPTTYETLSMEDSIVQYCVSHGLETSRGNTSIGRSVVKNNGGQGIRHNNSSVALEVKNCVIANNASYGIFTNTAHEIVIRDNVIYGNSSHGVYQTSTGKATFVLDGNIITENGGYGAYVNAIEHGKYNAFYFNTSGKIYRSSGLPDTAYNFELTADPFVDAANEDFNINDTTGGGAVLRALSVPLPGAASTTLYPFHALWDAGGGGVSSILGGGDFNGGFA